MLGQLSYRFSRTQMVVAAAVVLALSSAGLTYGLVRDLSLPSVTTASTVTENGPGNAAAGETPGATPTPTSGAAGGGVFALGPAGAGLNALAVHGGVLSLAAVITESGLGDETPVYHGLDASVKEIDARGGINGTRLSLEVLDDGSDPGRGQAALRRVVEEDHAFALVGECAPLTDIDAGPYFKQQQIPVFGACFTKNEDYVNPFVFPLVPQPFMDGRLMANYLTTQMGSKKPAVISMDVGVLDNSYQGALDQLQNQQHMSICDQQSVPLEQQVYDSYVLDEMRRGCDGIVLNLDPPRTLDWLQAAQRYNYLPKKVGLTAFDQSIIRASSELGSAADGIVTFFAQYMPNVETQVPEVRHYAQVMHAYYPDEPDLNLSIIGYMAGSYLSQALTNIQGPITRQSLINALYGAPLDTGIMLPAHWTPQNHQAASKSRFYALHNGAYQPVTGWYGL